MEEDNYPDLVRGLTLEPQSTTWLCEASEMIPWRDLRCLKPQGNGEKRQGWLCQDSDGKKGYAFIVMQTDYPLNVCLCKATNSLFLFRPTGFSDLPSPVTYLNSILPRRSSPLNAPLLS